MESLDPRMSKAKKIGHGALLVTSDWTVFQTNSILLDLSEPSAGFEVIIPVLVFYPILLAIMAWKYKWTNWREKLFGKVIPPTETDFIDKTI